MAPLLQSFVSSPPLPCSTISSQVPVCPTRNVTGNVMPLAQAITQLSFLEFLQRCGVPMLRSSRLSYQSPSHSWMLLYRRLHLVTSFRMCPRRLLINRSPRYVSMWQCRRLPTVSTSHLWMLRADDPTQYSVSARFYTDGFSLSFLVFC